VALESTGIYWLALYEVLEQYGFEVRVVNARHVKHVPGRCKTDVLDCQWIQKLHSFGLLNGSFRPDQQIRKLRTYQRLRDNLGVNNTQAIHHLQKALFEMNVQLSNVISDVTGETGLRIIEAILAGERNPEQLAALCAAGGSKPASGSGQIDGPIKSCCPRGCLLLPSVPPKAEPSRDRETHQKTLAGIKVNRVAAMEVFTRSTLPRFTKMALAAFPGMEKLPPNPKGALVSLVFNRGHDMADEGRREMAEIRRIIKEADLPAGKTAASPGVQIHYKVNQGIDILAQHLFGAVPGPKYTPAGERQSRRRSGRPIMNPGPCAWVKIRRSPS